MGSTTYLLFSERYKPAFNLVMRWLTPTGELPNSPFPVGLSKRLGMVALGLFFAILLILPPLAAQSSSYLLSLFDSFFRAGALVFGGGHVVLPVLQAEGIGRAHV